ncbi:hypothetical protein DFA_05250 [Cavenderia fasciculata]|uniref:Uncharacterized protein n=1 Tax=Cavenderia fasciculata TaxID=261658 RepID=F4PNR7_CACFS|nr:uncharacterized protein DFA_05250 [Cavenderia fasciculata]EGG23120.1 hypothetical protein DFA_05250 [Cavenderia fasciculata]|eukprot:XP_004360971.1 hypothetical protein DFA_05250 [Cavenderia fasciculata]
MGIYHTLWYAAAVSASYIPSVATCCTIRVFPSSLLFLFLFLFLIDLICIYNELFTYSLSWTSMNLYTNIEYRMTTKRPILESTIIKSPIRLLEKLSSPGEQDTPRPSKSTTFLIIGMQALQKGDLKAAQDKIQVAVDEAERNKENEELAASLLGLGYLYSFELNGQAVQPAKTLECYQKSLTLWKTIHPANSMRLIGLISDMAQLNSYLKNKQACLQLLDECKSIYKYNSQDKDSNQDYKDLLDVITKNS